MEACTADNGRRCINKECRLQHGDGRIIYKGKTFELWRQEFGVSLKDWLTNMKGQYNEQDAKTS